MEIAVGVLTVTVLYGAGLLVGILRTRDPIARRGIEVEKVSCGEACKLWDYWRQQRCNADAAARAARERADALLRTYLAYLATAAVFLASAYATMAIPIIGPAIANALFAASAALGALAIVVLGQHTAAMAVAAQLAAKAQETRQREAEARNAVLQNCSPEEAAACLSRPSPC